MNPHNLERRSKVASLLAAGLSVNKVGRETGVDPSTIRTWRKDPAFRALVDRHQERLINGIMSSLIGKGRRAVAVIAECMGKDEAAPVRLKAAGTILDKLLAVREHQQVKRELAEIRAILAAGDKGTPPCESIPSD